MLFLRLISLFSSSRKKRSLFSYNAYCTSQPNAMDIFEDFATFMNHHMDDNGWARLIKGQIISKHLIYLVFDNIKNEQTET